MAIQTINSGVNFCLKKGGEPASQFAEISHKIHQATSQKKAEDSLGTACSQQIASPSGHPPASSLQWWISTTENGRRMNCGSRNPGSNRQWRLVGTHSGK
ncbi:MAG: hypothetical protein WCF90_08725 [Methanomicrobiales archaeon]